MDRWMVVNIYFLHLQPNLIHLNWVTTFHLNWVTTFISCPKTFLSHDAHQQCNKLRKLQLKYTPPCWRLWEWPLFVSSKPPNLIWNSQWDSAEGERQRRISLQSFYECWVWFLDEHKKVCWLTFWFRSSPAGLKFHKTDGKSNQLNVLSCVCPKSVKNITCLLIRLAYLGWLSLSALF